MSNYKVFVRGLELYAFNGVSAEERTIGHRIIVDLEFEVNGSADQSDRVEDTLDYGDAAVQAAAFVQEHPCRTLEKLAESLAVHLLKSFPNAETIMVSIEKPMPPAPVIARSAGVRVMRARTTR